MNDSTDHVINTLLLSNDTHNPVSCSLRVASLAVKCDGIKDRYVYSTLSTRAGCDSSHDLVKCFTPHKKQEEKKE